MKPTGTPPDDGWPCLCAQAQSRGVVLHTGQVVRVKTKGKTVFLECDATDTPTQVSLECPVSKSVNGDTRPRPTTQVIDKLVAMGAFGGSPPTYADAAPPKVRKKDAVSAQKLAQLHPFIAVCPPERMGQFASFGPT
jgi:hypothetical protein